MVVMIGGRHGAEAGRRSDDADQCMDGVVRYPPVPLRRLRLPLLRTPVQVAKSAHRRIPPDWRDRGPGRTSGDRYLTRLTVTGFAADAMIAFLSGCANPPARRTPCFEPIPQVLAPADSASGTVPQSSVEVVRGEPSTLPGSHSVALTLSPCAPLALPGPAHGPRVRRGVVPP